MISLFLWTAIPDGYSSAAMIYNYIKLMDENYPVHYILHEHNKAHGLSDWDFKIPDNTKLLILPDSSTNDCKDCNKLIEDGIMCLVIDHHQQDSKCTSSNAIIVNNQISLNYSNKDFCGAGIVYEFLKALDDYYWQEYADDFIDLVAFANIADAMNLATYATRYMVNQGLCNIKNPALSSMIQAQEYSMRGEVNIHNMSFCIINIFNSMIRIGSIEDRDLLFRAFIGDYEEFDYKKRNGETIKENIYDRATRLCKNAKSRQDKMRDKLLTLLLDQVNIDDKIIMLQTKDGDSGIIGLSAMRLADKLSRPVIIVKPIEKNGQKLLSGSCRNFNNSPIENLRELIGSTGLFTFVAG